ALDAGPLRVGKSEIAAGDLGPYNVLPHAADLAADLHEVPALADREVIDHLKRVVTAAQRKAIVVAKSGEAGDADARRVLNRLIRRGVGEAANTEFSDPVYLPFGIVDLEPAEIAE